MSEYSSAKDVLNDQDDSKPLENKNTNEIADEKLEAIRQGFVLNSMTMKSNISMMSFLQRSFCV